MGYFTAVVTVAIGYVLFQMSDDLKEGGNPILICFFVVLCTAWVGGPGPTALAVGLLTWVTWPHELNSWRLMRMVIFLFEALAITLIIESGRDSTRRVSIEADQRRTEEERYRLIFEGNPQPMWVYDLETLMFLAVNQAAVKNYGYSREEFLAMTIADIRDPDGRAQLLAAVKKGKSTRVHRAGVWRHRCKDKSYIEVEIMSTALDFGGRAARLVLAGDVTARARSERDRDSIHRSEQRARREAEAANQAKDRFIATLSHELRTPLTPILAGVSALLLEPDIDPAVRSVLELTLRNVELEARLIEDLLDVSRIRQEKLSLAFEVVDARTLIHQAIDICRDGIDRSGVEIVLDFKAEHNLVRGDPARLSQVFWNLILNAVKFTPTDGQVTIRTSNPAAASSTLAGTSAIWRLEVIDTGVGIEPDLLPRIFDLFEQGNNPRIHGSSGLGLGLSICKSIVDAHGGSIGASSPGKDQGAVFTIDLAVADPEEIPSVESQPADPLAESPQGFRILLVDDDSDTRRVLGGLLDRKGHAVDAASSGEEAIMLLNDCAFDILICDIRLPGMSGLELMRSLQARATIKGIAVSGLGNPRDIEQTTAAGFSEHLVKPIAFAELEAAIDRVMASND